MTALITGLTHPIGQYLLELACAQGLPVRALAGADASRPGNGAELIAGTIDDDAALMAAVRNVRVVYHTALIAQGTPQELRRVNAGGTRRLLEACGGDVGRFVLISTPAVYTSHPTEESWPVLADAPRQAHGPAPLLAYGESMIEAEDYVLEAHQRYAMEYCILRTATAWGRNAYAASIIRFLMSAPERAEQMGNALGPMQWIHGLDAARAALLAGSHEAAANQAFLVAAAEAVTSHDLLRQLWDITRPTEPNPFVEQAQARRPSRTKLDVSKIRESLGFEPAISLRQSLEEILGQAALSPALGGALADVPQAGADAADMAGKTCVITGATSGIGLATAERLAAMGARLILVGRDPAKGEAALQQIRAASPAVDASIFQADLSRLGDVRRVAAAILEAAPKIDVLINNAGAIYDSREITEDGLERSFVTNYLSHFLLTALLHDRLVASAPARILTVTSSSHRGATVDFADLQNERVGSGFAAYQRAKLYCILFTRELARRLAGTGVVVCSLHPGAVASNLGNDLSGPMGAWLAHAKQTMSVSPEKAAEGMANLASSAAVIDANGKYFDQGQLATPAPAAEDDLAAKRLWEESAVLAGL